jgi:ABC-type polysaccharide/polyol phosphate transport system ATPase subunit
VSVPNGRIEFQHVWKKFRRGELHDSLRDLVPHLATRVFHPRRRAEHHALNAREFWALEDVTFAVRPGEALGIIGPNGAGKSTILKLLTRILHPTRGRCGIRGRVGALIEIAAGFHQDLTGAENVFLQGCIMGMTRREIEARFDDIVAFSELAEFIDTPVKRYSSGMNARLGFAIAAHMSPDVLIVDEVLAVGDYHFQQKAYARIGDMVRRGLPVVIVSHQLERIAALCNNCLLLDRGRIIKRGRPDDCIAHYLNTATIHGEDEIASPFRITDIAIEPPRAVRSGEWIRVQLRGETLVPIAAHQRLAVRVRSLQNAQILHVIDLTKHDPRIGQPGSFEATIEMQANMNHGYFSIEPYGWDNQERREFGAGCKALIQIERSGFFGTINLHPRLHVDVQLAPWCGAERSRAAASVRQ